MSTDTQNQARTATSWVRIPDGTKVRHRDGGYEGVIDGLTQIVAGPHRNPDGKTQYRVNIGDATRRLASEDHLSILLDSDNLVMIARQKDPYRRSITEQLQATLAPDRFVKLV